MNRQRLTATGRPACGNGCRYERGNCPTHGPMTAGEDVLRISNFLATHKVLRGKNGHPGSDSTCAGCGYHVCACPPKPVAQYQNPADRATFAPVAPVFDGTFRVGDIVRINHPICQQYSRTHKVGTLCKVLEVFPSLGTCKVRSQADGSIATWCYDPQQGVVKFEFVSRPGAANAGSGRTTAG